MLNEKYNSTCDTCHQHEKQGGQSSRAEYARNFTKNFDEVIANTREDGHIDDFKMRYFDIRFNNICNFKCRTCNAAFSSQWEQEDIKRNMPFAKIYPKNNRPEMMQELIKQVPNMETAYFAGGEPLITEEHYIMLEEMIRQGKTDIWLRYNTNVSNLKFKNKDILDLWSKFKRPIDLWASVDHYGERAEYIRHGTDWGVVESNLFKLKDVPYVRLSINTVVSIFNYVTLNDFYKYLIDKNIYTSKGPTFSAYNMSSPEHFTALALPVPLKQQGEKNMLELMDYMSKCHFNDHKLNLLKSNVNWVNSSNTWEQYKDQFQQEVRDIDSVRGEDFVKVFPELASLMD
jgi:organic radical activating enzyme